MVLGILSLVVCAVLRPFAMGLAISARREMTTGTYSQGSRTMATAGLVMGVIGTAIVVFWIIVIIFAAFLP
jgi:uncharacterized membrane-anchored protein